MVRALWYLASCRKDGRLYDDERSFLTRMIFAARHAMDSSNGPPHVVYAPVAKLGGSIQE